MCIVMCMRTNIVIDDELMREAMEYSTARTKRSLIEEALHTFISVHATEKRRESYRTRLAVIRKKTAELRLRTSPGDLLREDRERQ